MLCWKVGSDGLSAKGVRVVKNLKPILIGDFLHRIRRPIELISDKNYKLVTIKMKHKGVVLRGEKLASNIKSKMYKVQEGDFILSGIDARNGAFGIVPKELDGAIVTNDFWYFDIDESIVDKHFFLELTTSQWFDEICRKGSDGTTQRIRLQKNKFFNQEINLPPIEQQDKFLLKFKNIKQNNDDLKSELNHQQTLLKKLRQQILQEAIEGKLSEQWRIDNGKSQIEPASELLQRIQAKKQQLIKDKKIRKQKPLPPISEEEKPFVLPDDWVWCRLNDLFNFIDYRGKTPIKLSKGIRLITARNVKDGFLSLVPQDFISRKEFKERMTRGFPKNNDILFTTEAPLGNICLLDLKEDQISTGQRLITFQSYRKVLKNKVFMFFMLSPFYQEFLITKATGMTAKGIKASKLKGMLIPLPPLQEQKAIVTKVEKLLAYCDQLETQITNNQSHAEKLMQAVLKEAFAQKTKTTIEPSV
ncbi:MAG: restriction endonuclease subunit S [Proteobacteria bacterium]|nr:restriction endonuclease subunit S [Pseudomonadota bacterium]